MTIGAALDLLREFETGDDMTTRAPTHADMLPRLQGSAIEYRRGGAWRCVRAPLGACPRPPGPLGAQRVCSREILARSRVTLHG